MPRKPKAGLPTPKQILEFIETSDQPAGKREIARAFGLKGNDKIALKTLLKDMADEGLIDSAPGRAFHKMGGVPKVTVLRVTSVEDGEVWATPEQWHAEKPAPKLRVIERGKRSALGLNDRILARTEERGKGHVAHVMKKLQRSADLVLGVVRLEGDRHYLTPVDKRERRELPISDLGDAQPGDLVLAEPSGRPPRVTARVDAILGDPFAPRSFSLIAIHKHGLRDEFRDEAIAEAKKVARQKLGEEREDLTHLPIVAIDPEDARDHDDAIWAQAREDGDGWDAIVVIADVSYYVRPGSELDREARARGNSVYFPDRVVPMLPHELSSDMCSLKEGQLRAAMACHLHIGKDGALKSWRFTRAKICVVANIAYENAQAAIDAAGEEVTEVSSSPCAMPAVEGPVPAEIVEKALRPLWACWRALLSAREKREPLELDLPERRVVLDEKGRILSVAPRERLDAHRLVEDYMIAANVAAAKALEKKKAPVMYRVHEAPSRVKLTTLKDYLGTFDIEFALGQVIRPATFNRIIERVGDDHEARPEIMEQLLRTQMQARYSPETLGHFGLSLGAYAHFTSPIRRYADLLVHRALVSAYKLGEGGLPAEDGTKFEDIGEQISMLERRAMEAERETVDRYVAAFLADKVGQILRCRITGVQPFGFFATVEDLGGDGLVPAAILGNEYFRYDEASQSLIGEQSSETFAMGQKIELKLAEANPASGALRFELPEGRFAGPQRQRKDRVRTRARRGRPGNIRHQGRRRR
ncbi:VacB/RNase II family 3'-5' exoribonuclease [Sphingomonas sp. HDW15A]|uniref:ribonuclease R family protein n=1 Tax=Sphingomonas sp. HDW15A TaxID=2714942 RepID=UPI001407FAF7|nr:VacB/RNase II family 3'-5' exoribonuclease [Sphingomonas sp. HDW15A]QIK95451.1 VacB/RNase II family 3'-5' exoribonuclease [Sphingomonas sp. HDW15A]